MEGEVYCNGVISVFVPEDWKVFNGAGQGEETLKKIHIYKNVENEMDVFFKAGITVCYYGENDIYLTSRGFYDNVEDIETFTLGDYTWSGYTCTSLGYPYTILEAFKGDIKLQVMVLKENRENKISMDDDDVKAIIESIKV